MSTPQVVDMTLMLEGYPELVTCIVWLFALIRDNPWKPHATMLYVLQLVNRKFRSIVISIRRGRNRYNVCGYAARHGYLSLLKWGISQRFHCLKTYAANAIRFGQIEVFDYIMDLPQRYMSNIIEPDKLYRKILMCAVRHGNIEKFKYVLDKVMSLGWDDGTGTSTTDIDIKKLCPLICMPAAARGHFEMLKWLIEQGYPLSCAAYIMAGKNGHFDILKWLPPKSTSVGFNDSTHFSMSTIETSFAAENKKYDMLKWLIENDYKYHPPMVFYMIVKNGDIEIFKWLRQKINITIDYEAMVCVAVENGHLEIFKWFECEHNVSNPRRAFVQATNFNQPHVVKYLKNTYGFKIDETIPIHAINFGVIKKLHAKGCKLTAKTFQAATWELRTHEDLEKFEWLKSVGCPWDEYTMKFLLMNIRGEYRLFKWLVKNGCPRLSDSDILGYLIDIRNLKLLKFSFKHGLFNKDTKNISRFSETSYNIRRWAKSVGIVTHAQYPFLN